MARKAEVIITCDASTVKQVLEGINREIAHTNQERKKLLDTQKRNGALTEDEKKQLRDLDKYLASLIDRQQKTVGEMRKFGDVIRDLAGSKLKDLKKALQEGKNALNNMAGNDPRRAKLVSDLKKIQQQIERNTGAIKQQGNVLATTAKNLATYMVGFAGFNKVKSLVEGVFQSNLKLSDSLADIRKVSGLAMSDINQLYRNIAQIDSRNTIETLNSLAYTGAKLGIGQNYGVEGLTGFVKAAEQVQMALGEDMGEKALPELAKMTEVMGLIEKYGVEQSMQKAASAIFQLGATSTATGSNIVEFSKRLYGLANVSRIGADDLLALGSAADAMGLMPEVAATAFNKLFTSIQKNHNMIEKTLGLQPGLIKGYYDQGKTMEAVVAIFEKMNQTGNLNLLGNVFKDLGSDGARLVNVMATMSDRVDILKKHLETSRDAFKEGEAVIGEYMIQNQTAQAMLERASNLWAKAFTNPEGVDMVKQLAQAWYDLSKRMTESEGTMATLRTSLEWIATSIKAIIALSPYLIRFGIVMASAFGVKGLITGIAGLRTMFTAFVTEVRMATTAMGAFNAVAKSNFVLTLAAAVTTLATVLWDFSKAAEEAAKRETERQAKLKAAFEGSKEAVQNVIKPLETYKKVLDEANLSEKQKMELVKDFRNTYQDYLDYLGLEVKTVDDLRDAYARVVEVMKIKKAYEERESYRDQVNGTNRMDRISNQAQVEAQLQSMGVSGIDKAWLEKNQHLGTQGMYEKLMEQRYGKRYGIRDGSNYTIDLENPNGEQRGPRAKHNFKNVGNSALWEAINNYILSYRTERQVNKETDAKFDSEYTWTDADGKKRKLSEFDLDDYNQKVQEARYKRKGSLDNDAPDKNALKAARKAAQEAKAAARKELKDAETETNAIIAKVEEWYTLQQGVVTDAYNDGQLTEQQMKNINQQLEATKNQALAAARRSLSGQDTVGWDTFKAQMHTLMLDQSDWSKELLDAILSTDMDALRGALARFDGKKSLEQWGFTSTAFRDGLNKNAAKNEAKVRQLGAAAQKAVEQMLEQYHFVEQAIDGFSDRLATMGILTETARHMAQRLADANDINTAYSEKDYQAELTTQEQSKRDAFQAFRSSGTRAYAVNPESTDDLDKWLRELTGAEFGGIGAQGAEFKFSPWAEAFRDDFTLWLKDSERYKDKMQAFYLSLLGASDEYYKAERQQYEFYRKQNEQQWENSGRKEYYDQQYTSLGNQQQLQDTFGTGQTFSQQYGLADAIANDPEVELYKQKLQAAAEYYQFVESHQHTEQELREAQQATLEAYMAMAKKVTDEITERASKITELTQPISDFAEDAGQKLGDMMFNMESQSMTWNQIIKKMILSFAQMTIKMAAENLTKKIQMALFYKQMQAMEIEHQTALLGIQTAFGAMQIGAQQTINTTRQGIQTADNVTTIGKEVSLATALTALGISEGAAKTIGKLGWWGIPLVAVIASLLMGLLSSALSSAGASSDAATSSSSTASTPKTKLVSGMLTYDRGNVQQVGRSIGGGSQIENRKSVNRKLLYDDGNVQVYDRDGRRPVVGTDGRVYMVRDEQELETGIVTTPTATSVNGQPAIVGERGPEIVIGRETTQQIMMNEPGLLQHLIDLDRYRSGRPYRAYDSGNVSQFGGDASSVESAFNADNSGNDDRIATTLERAAAAEERSNALLQSVLHYLQNPVAPNINMYGENGLGKKVSQYNKFMARYGG